MKADCTRLCSIFGPVNIDDAELGTDTRMTPAKLADEDYSRCARMLKLMECLKMVVVSVSSDVTIMPVSNTDLNSLGIVNNCTQSANTLPCGPMLQSRYPTISTQPKQLLYSVPA